MTASQVQGKSSLTHAYDLQQAAAKIGFTWASPHEAMAKIHEELNELEHALASGDQTEIKAESGDLLYSIVNFLRLAGIHPEDALAATAQKFARRLNGMHDDIATDGIDFQAASLATKLNYWNRRKAKV